MKPLLRWRNALLCGVALSSVTALCARGNFDLKLDRAWKHYRNADYGYCVSYPSRWRRGEAFDGAGLVVETGVNKFSRPVGAIDFEAISSVTKDARAMPASLVEDLQDHLAVLQKFERAERMEILEKREMQLRGNSALFLKNRYYDPQERATWMEEVLFVNRHETVYRLELECRADQIARFEPVFEYLMGTLQFDCEN
jgi:hypothetical protein